MPFKLFDSCGDTTQTMGAGTLTGTGVSAMGWLQGPIAAGVTSGIQTTIRIETPNRRTWEERLSTVTVISGLCSYSIDEFICSSSGAPISWAAGAKNIFYNLPVMGLTRGQLARRVSHEIPSPLIDGIEVTFTLANAPLMAGNGIPDLDLYQGGVLMSPNPDGDYDLTGDTIVFNNPPTGILRANYTW